MTERQWGFVLFMIGVLMTAVTLTMVFLLFFVPGKAPPVELVSTDYKTPVACPGDALTYSNTLYINRPVALAITAPIRDAIRGDTVIFDSQPIYTSAYAAQEFIDRENTLIVPDLPPGEYDRMVTTWAVNERAEPAIIVQRFIIPDDCSD